jgi:hypothetical protein
MLTPVKFNPAERGWLRPIVEIEAVNTDGGAKRQACRDFRWCHKRLGPQRGPAARSTKAAGELLLIIRHPEGDARAARDWRLFARRSAARAR